MTKEEVKKKIAEVLELMREERELKDQLVELELFGEPDEVERAFKKQAQLVAAIDQLRWERLLPIVQEVGAFIASRQGEAGPGAELAATLEAAVRGQPVKRPAESLRGPRPAPAPTMKPASAPAWPAAKALVDGASPAASSLKALRRAVAVADVPLNGTPAEPAKPQPMRVERRASAPTGAGGGGPVKRARA